MIDKSLILILQYFAIGISFFEFLFVSLQKPSDLQKHAIVLTLSTLFMFLGYNIELSANCLDAAITGTAVSYVGKPFIMLSSFMFICTFYHQKLSKKLLAILSVFCTSFSILVFSNKNHHLYYATTDFNGEASFSPLVITRGPLYYSYIVLAVAYFISCLYVVIIKSKRLKDKSSRQLNIYIVLMVLSGIGGYAVYLSGLTGSYDFTMFGVFIGVICLFIMFVKCRIFDAVTIGKDQALDDSLTGLIIFDYAGELSYQNSVVRSFLDDDISLEYLRDLNEGSFKHIADGRALLITCKPLYANEACIGKSVEIADITEFHDYQKRLEHDVRERTEKLVSMQRRVIGSVANIIEARSQETGEHIKRTSDYSMMIARSMKEKHLHPELIDDEFIEILGSAATLHDIGKISVPDYILLKEGPLTEEEFISMTTHVDSGGAIIEDSMRGVETDDYVRMAKDIALFHHERWDGTGYSLGLKGESIPVSARIVAVADCFDALSTKRVYKKAMSNSEAIDIIISERGTHFDPDVVDAFVDALSKQ